MDFDFMATSERSCLNVLYNHGVVSNWNVCSGIADIHQKQKKVTP